MILPVLTWANNWPQWLLYHKAIFDGPNKLIFIDPNATEIDVRRDLYSAWKEWMYISEQAGGALKWDAAFSSVGGEDLPGGRSLGRTFFLINGWRIFLDHGVEFTGNLFTEEGESPFILDEGVQIATSVVSTLVEEVTGAVAAADLAQAVWDQAVASVNAAGSMGELLRRISDATILMDTTVASAADASNLNLAGVVGVADGFYDEHFLQVTDGNRFAVALIDTTAADGSVILAQELPFIPSAGAQALILAQRNVGGGYIN